MKVFNTIFSQFFVKKNWINRWLFIFSFSAVFAIILYFTVWKIPGDSVEAERTGKEIESRLKEAMKLPSDKNAWFLYRRALVELAEKREKMRREGNSPSGGSSGGINSLRELKEANINILNNVDSAFYLDDFQYPVDFEKIQKEEDIAEMQFTKKLAEFLIFLGDMEKNSGDYDEAMRRYLQTLHLGHGLGRNSYLLCGAYSVSIQSVALWRINALLNGSLQKEDFYQLIIRQMERIDSAPSDYKEILKTEVLLGHKFFNYVRAGLTDNSNIFSRSDFYMSREKQIFNNIYIKTIRSISGNYSETCTNLEKQTYTLPLFSIFNSRRIPMFLTGYKQFARYKVQYGGIMILAALKEYRVEKGEYPDALSMLVPKYLNRLPEDIFSSDGNYCYKISGDNILLYSVGNDMKDDQGKFRAKKTDNLGDVIFAR